LKMEDLRRWCRGHAVEVQARATRGWGRLLRL
jgi:NOL1/NOP2/fmu family ribosome biogenesis protein